MLFKQQENKRNRRPKLQKKPKINQDFGIIGNEIENDSKKQTEELRNLITKTFSNPNQIQKEKVLQEIQIRNQESNQTSKIIDNFETELKEFIDQTISKNIESNFKIYENEMIKINDSNLNSNLIFEKASQKLNPNSNEIQKIETEVYKQVWNKVQNDILNPISSEMIKFYETYLNYFFSILNENLDSLKNQEEKLIEDSMNLFYQKLGEFEKKMIEMIETNLK
ncbi:hypothetical protein M0811_14005 [Anaeramoeba ignava]|uniref:Uncharacterized protein n=1 Tax=Anaeramoeba ignava TaxID=1746090 RepID=A0A9Q0LXH5_ANAIG|nr:hypothetical protein M0811_14005 [Anaeramoeba ignava]